MSVEILTKEDLNNFKVELVNLITEIISKGQPQKKKFSPTRM